MASKTPERDYSPLLLLLTSAIIFLIVFSGVPIAWLAKHGAEYGLGGLTWQLRDLLQAFPR